MKTTGRLADISLDFKTQKGKLAILIDTKRTETLELLEKLKDKKLDIEIKQHREKRSGNANRYFWELLGEICELKGLNPLEDYKRRVKELGIFRISRVEAKDYLTYKKTWEHWGEAWFCEIADTEYLGDREFKVLHLYYGSSSFNTKQMSRLIDGLIQDCKAIGIETKPQKEIDSMLKEWEK